VRETDKDFEFLKIFIEDYNLRAIGQNTSHLKDVKTAHKSYFSFLQFWSVCLNEANKKSFSIFNRQIPIETQEFLHLRESVSDVGSGLFCCLHGAYKPGYMALRSSIENYLRFSSGIFDGNAITTTSVYELFDIAKKIELFSNGRKTYLQHLRCSYIELCKYSHSASLNHMSGIHALDYFPTFDTQSFQSWLTLAKKCMTAMVTVTMLGNQNMYLKAHFNTRELIDLLIPKAERITILGGKKI